MGALDSSTSHEGAGDRRRTDLRSPRLIPQTFTHPTRMNWSTIRHEPFARAGCGASDRVRRALGAGRIAGPVDWSVVDRKLSSCGVGGSRQPVGCAMAGGSVRDAGGRNAPRAILAAVADRLACTECDVLPLSSRRPCIGSWAGVDRLESRQDAGASAGCAVRKLAIVADEIDADCPGRAVHRLVDCGRSLHEIRPQPRGHEPWIQSEQCRRFYDRAYGEWI